MLDTFPPALLSDKALARYLGVHVATVWRRVQDGTLPKPIKVGGCTRWSREEIDAVIRRELGRRDGADNDGPLAA